MRSDIEVMTTSTSRYILRRNQAYRSNSGPCFPCLLFKRLKLTVLGLPSTLQSIQFSLEDRFDIASTLLAIQLGGEISQLLIVNLGNNGIDIIEYTVNLRCASVALGKIISILCRTTNDTLVLLR